MGPYIFKTKPISTLKKKNINTKNLKKVSLKFKKSKNLYNYQ